jgi:hypothetical protein
MFAHLRTLEPLLVIKISPNFILRIEYIKSSKSKNDSVPLQQVRTAKKGLALKLIWVCCTCKNEVIFGLNQTALLLASK